MMEQHYRQNQNVSSGKQDKTMNDETGSKERKTKGRERRAAGISSLPMPLCRRKMPLRLLTVLTMMMAVVFYNDRVNRSTFTTSVSSDNKKQQEDQSRENRVDLHDDEIMYLEHDAADANDSSIHHDDNEDDLRYILYYNRYVGHSDFSFGMGQQPFVDAGCKETRCFATDDPEHFAAKKSKKTATATSTTTGNKCHADNVEECNSRLSFDAVLFNADGFTSVPLDKRSDYHDVIQPWNEKKRRQTQTPSSRRQQRFIYVNMESPFYQFPPSVYPSFRDFFDWTMTYRLDSDLPRPYGWFYRLDDVDDHGNDPEEQQLPMDPLMLHHPPPILDGQWPIVYDEQKWFQQWQQQQKQRIRRLAATGKSRLKREPKVGWIVSNCNAAPSNRAALAKELEQKLGSTLNDETNTNIKLVEWDQYGKCPGSKHSCRGIRGGDECTEAIQENQFYFSAENAPARDYMTEKVFFRMTQGFLPIVYGCGTDCYERQLPPHSYINIMDYASIDDVVQHIQQLAANETEYASYFWWRDYYGIMTNIQVAMNRTFCHLCAKLHETTSGMGKNSKHKERRATFDGDLFHWWIRQSRIPYNPIEEWYPEWNWRHLE